MLFLQARMHTHLHARRVTGLCPHSPPPPCNQARPNFLAVSHIHSRAWNGQGTPRANVHFICLHSNAAHNHGNAQCHTHLCHVIQVHQQGGVAVEAVGPGKGDWERVL
jgi:hypothetical protein